MTPFVGQDFLGLNSLLEVLLCAVCGGGGLLLVRKEGFGLPDGLAVGLGVTLEGGFAGGATAQKAETKSQ